MTHPFFRAHAAAFPAAFPAAAPVAVHDGNASVDERIDDVVADLDRFDPFDVIDSVDIGDVAVAGWQPSKRARRAEELAQIVLADPAVADPLRALVHRAVEVTAAENAQISLLSTRQIAVAVQQGSRAPEPASPPTYDGNTTALADTVCAVSVRSDASLSIPDARLDDRVASLPAVTSGVMGAYLGSPIRVADGSVVGVLCAFDRGPHEWTSADEHQLDVLADEVAAVLDRIHPAAS